MSESAADATAARSPVMELPRPTVVHGGRLRLMGFPDRLPNFSVTKLELRVDEAEEVVALPLTMGGRHGRSMLGAAYDRDGNLLAESERSTRRKGWHDNPEHIADLRRPSAQRLPGRTLFAGRISRHFGHVLLETITRAWSDPDYNAYDQLLVYPNRALNYTVSVSSLFRDVLNVAHIPVHKVHIMGTASIVIDRLDLPSSPFRLTSAADPRFLAAFDRIGCRVERDVYRGDLGRFPRRVYLSRSHLQDKRRAVNEAGIEALMRDHGFAVVHPQELPLPEQVASIRSAQVIAGCDGSALHLATFARPGAKLLAVDTRVVANQFMIEQARELDAVHVWGAVEDIGNRLEPWSAHLTRIRSALELLLDDR